MGQLDRPMTIDQAQKDSVGQLRLLLNEGSQMQAVQGRKLPAGLS